jgi:oxaloacetate decarboxylase alpha subunit
MKKEGTLDPKVLNVDTQTLMYQVPGGMLSNLISQLKQANASDKYYEVLAEIPRVRKDFGYPPLVTPTSQIVGTQAVFNVLNGERYKMVTKESKGLLRGEYGHLPGEVNEEVRKKAIGDAEVITCRPADLIEPEVEKYRIEAGDKAKCEEDILSYALFPQVAEKFFEKRNNPKTEEPAKSQNSNETRTIYVEDISE